jgi:hypothetical protein
MTTSLTEREFTQHLHTKFRFKLDPEDVELELVEVKRYEGGNHDQEAMESFSIFFNGPPNPLLAQQTYSVEHARMGTFDLFIVPIARQPDGYHYEAVFNYFKQR